MSSTLRRTVALAGAVALAGLSSPLVAQAAETATCSGTVSWAVKDSYFGYMTEVNPTFPDLKLEAIGDAEIGEKTITFPIDGAATLASAKDGAVTIVTTGGFHATGHKGKMDTTVENLKIAVPKDHATGTVSIDFKSKPRVGAAEAGDMETGSGDVVSLKFNPALSDAAAAKGVSAPATYVKSDAVKALPYEQGTQMAPVTIKATGCGLGEEVKTPAPQNDEGSSTGVLGILGALAAVIAALAAAFQWAVSQGLVPAPR